MKNDQLIDAIGKLDDTLFSEIEASMQTERTVVRDAASNRRAPRSRASERADSCSSRLRP